MFFYRDSIYGEDYFSFFMKKKGFEQEPFYLSGGFSVIFTRGNDSVEITSANKYPEPSAPAFDNDGKHTPHLEKPQERGSGTMKVTFSTPMSRHTLIKESVAMIEAYWLTLKNYEEATVRITSVTPPDIKEELEDALIKKGIKVERTQEIVVDFHCPSYGSTA